MLDATSLVLYVGKAKNLKKRVSSYFVGAKDAKTTQLISQVDKIEVTITRSEQEAYILENSLIKELQPKYNVIFRDDKSYPYIRISNDSYPILDLYRGSGSKKIGTLYGPYPSARSVKDSIDILQRTFKLRNCSNSFFSSRTRPCLQYQIKRCSAPCVKYIEAPEYNDDVKSAVQFLTGTTNDLMLDLVKKMDAYSFDLEYEKATKIRDQIVLLRNLQKQQVVIAPNSEANIDVLAVQENSNRACVYLLVIRDGRIIGSREFLFNINNILTDTQEAILEAFLKQYYSRAINVPGEEHTVKGKNKGKNTLKSENTVREENAARVENTTIAPKEILVSLKLANKKEISAFISHALNKKIIINDNVIGYRATLLTMAINNADNTINMDFKNTIHYSSWFESLSKTLNTKVQQIACFDVSHTQGNATVASMVFFNQYGPNKAAYRIYNIKTTDTGDDYQALREALTRYFTAATNKTSNKLLPDIILIDGGKGQLKILEETAKECNMKGVKFLAIAKGENRTPGKETIFLTSSGDRLDFEKADFGFLLLQHVRDEAHRFAITSHRKKLTKKSMQSILETIPGIGAKKRKDILSHFGGLEELKKASLLEIATVPGINKKLAGEIYGFFHKEHH